LRPHRRAPGGTRPGARGPRRAAERALRPRKRAGDVGRAAGRPGAGPPRDRRLPRRGRRPRRRRRPPRPGPARRDRAPQPTSRAVGPGSGTIGAMKGLRSVGVKVVVGSFSLAALLGILALLGGGSFSETQGRVLLPTVIVGVESVAVLCYLSVGGTRRAAVGL